MDISSTAPAPSISFLKFRLCSFPPWEGPNPSDWIIPEGRAGLLFSHLLFNPRWGQEMSPWPSSHPSVQRQSEVGALPAHRGSSLLQPHTPAEQHSSASQNTCPKFSSLIHTLLSHVQALLFHEEPLMGKSKPASLAGIPRVHCPEPWDTGPAQEQLIWEKHLSVLLFYGN